MSVSSHSVWVVIERFEGSSPREVGAAMLVTLDAVQGTVGGGHLEFDAIAYARSWLQGQPFEAREETRRYALGPSLGQCCGGVVWLRFAAIAAGDAMKLEALRADSARARAQNDIKIALFGGGHVGQAIVRALGPLPCQVHWIDSRDEIFPGQLPAGVQAEHSAPVQAAVPSLAPQSHVLIMSFSHAEDLDVVAACLKRERELAQITCPIGLPGIAGKEPEVIAASVAAQLLQFRKL
jgi:xanthine dehydrogenase accessory factor